VLRSLHDVPWAEQLHRCARQHLADCCVRLFQTKIINRLKKSATEGLSRLAIIGFAVVLWFI
jgi:hypothetical protein